MSEQRIEFTAEAFAAPKELDKVQTIALGVGLAGIALCVIGFLTSREQFFQSYHLAWVYWLSISLGSLGLLMIQHMAQGDWGLVTRRVNEASAGTIAVLVPLFLPTWLGLGTVFHWVHRDPADKILAAKAWFLNTGGFSVRVVAYFAITLLLGWSLIRLSSRQDREPSAQLIQRMRQIAAPGLVLLAVVTTLISVDFVMALDAHWYSSIYGIYFIGSMLVAAMAFLITVSHWLSRRPPMNQLLVPKIFHAQGKLQLAFILLWAYFSVSQLIITWSGNLPEEIFWYQHRTSHGWGWLALAVVFLHFVLPFALLLSQPRKFDSSRLVKVALLMLCVHWLDFFWQAAPTFHDHLTAHWLDFATMAAVGGLWVWTFLTLLKRRPIAPYRDPYLPEVLAHE